MKKLMLLLITLNLLSCSQSSLQEENEELLQLTRDLTETVEELKLEAEKHRELAIMAAADARKAEAEALEQRKLAFDQAAEATKMRAELEKKLQDCN